ncbi:MAG: FG-GAP-like repeat-containing protein [Lentisphaerae bacterium]|nr:FG-GAP-like repeat-containing protein [Lentisphaerota bacterium]
MRSKTIAWSPKRPAWGGLLLVALATLATGAPSGPTPRASVQFTQSSSPADVLSQSVTVTTPASVTTQVAPPQYRNYRFIHWTINGTRANDFLGVALNPVALTLYEDTAAVATYQLRSLDADADRVNDWYERYYLGDTSFPADSDDDLDGAGLRTEYERGWHPRIADSTRPGGVSQRDSVTLTFLRASGYTYTERSEPNGVLPTANLTLPGGARVTTLEAPGFYGQFAFGQWSLNGVRQADALGTARTQVSLTVTTDTQLVALYLPRVLDGNANGAADWFEWRYTGALQPDSGQDSDGDGADLRREYGLATNPHVADNLHAGGVSARDSRPLTFSREALRAYQITSLPAGVLDSLQGLVSTGTVITTPEAPPMLNVYAFGFWSANGERQADALGQALSQVSCVVTQDLLLEAHYFERIADEDTDGVADWFEWRYADGPTTSPESNPDGDGATLREEYRQGWHPHILDVNWTGGCSARDSGLATLNLQMFERLEYALQDGVLTNVFTFWPAPVTGRHFGTNSAPALGDWDHDGDWDLFVGTDGQPLAVFENVGSAHTLDFVDRSAAFVALGIMGDPEQTPTYRYPALGDWNGDGAADLALGATDGTVRLLASAAQFTGAVTGDEFTLAVGAAHAVPALGDINGDTFPDLLVVTGDGDSHLYLNSGTPGAPFSTASVIHHWLPAVIPGACGLALQDITFDGVTDVVASDQDGRIWEFHGDGLGHYALISKVWAGSGNGFAPRLTASLADLDDDGDVDAIAGFQGGGLLCLRDPRVGIPTGMQASGAADAILVTWAPDRQYRVMGYYLYRATSPDGPFERIAGGNILRVPGYTDTNVVPGVTYHYYATSLASARLPGFSTPRLRESDPSRIVSATAGSIAIWMPDYQAAPGTTAVLRLSVVPATGLAGENLLLGITYDPNVLTPAAQAGQGSTVWRTPLTEDVAFTDNGLSASGELIIRGSAGTVIGNGHLFDVHFVVATNAPMGTACTNRFSAATLYSAAGQALAVDAADVAVFTVAMTYFLGDGNGDGVLDMSDHEFLMALLQRDARAPTTQELAALDLDGNGRLETQDIPLHLRLIHGESINP